MKNIKEIFETAQTALGQGLDVMLLTIISSSGSAPRGAGSRMLVMPDGTSHGTIGGGNIEYTATKDALEGLGNQQSFSRHYTLRNGEAADLGMVCGGEVTVYFQYIPHTDKHFQEMCSTLLNEWTHNKNIWFVLDITDESAWSAGFYGNRTKSLGLDCELLSAHFESHAIVIEADGHRYYIEPLVASGTVYVFGGGHVAQELVPVLAHLDFRCVVLDDRSEFANRTIFPNASKCIVGDFEHLSDYIDIQPEDYVCIMTRGHLSDYIVQKQVLHTDASYIGVMGSRKKTAMIREKLLADGFTDPEIDRCKSPIGLDIQAETPAEIAISIAGELIAARAK